MTAIFQFIATLFFVSVVSSVGACTSTQNIDGDQAVSSSMPEKVSLASKDSGEMIKEFSDTDEISLLVAALDSRERSYEKLYPLFEYKLNISANGEQETWFVNKAGYLRKSDSSELYKMDVSTIFK